MKLIVGLGNPGLRYKNTRHNIGFMVLDRVAKETGIRIKKRVFNSLCGRGKIENEETVFLKPLTYMNSSGKAVKEVKYKENIELGNILIVMDDMDLPLGNIRLRPKGSSGGHKGLQSIIEELGTEDLPRLRVGISPGRRERDLSSYVLSPFKKGEKEIVDDLMARCSNCIRAWISEGAGPVMNRFNS